MIKDIHSMHGSQLNDMKLPIDSPRAIKNGDILSFGAEVRRGLETFPPCRCHVEYEFVPWTYGTQTKPNDERSDCQPQASRPILNVPSTVRVSLLNAKSSDTHGPSVNPGRAGIIKAVDRMYVSFHGILED
jgi:hypothetical protein